MKKIVCLCMIIILCAICCTGCQRKTQDKYIPIDPRINNEVRFNFVEASIYDGCTRINTSEKPTDFKMVNFCNRNKAASYICSHLEAAYAQCAAVSSLDKLYFDYYDEEWSETIPLPFEYNSNYTNSIVVGMCYLEYAGLDLAGHQFKELSLTVTIDEQYLQTNLQFLYYKEGGWSRCWIGMDDNNALKLYLPNTSRAVIIMLVDQYLYATN